MSVNLKMLLLDFQPFHGRFQQDVIITRMHGKTEYGCYLQALRELHTRYVQLGSDYCERDLLRVRIRRKDRDLEKETDELEREELLIKRRKLSFRLDDLCLHIRDMEREFTRFYSQAVFLKSRLGELTEERRIQLDWEAWVFNVKFLVVADLLAEGRLTMNTVDLLTACPEDIRKEVADLQLHDRDSLEKWLLEQKPVAVIGELVDARPALQYIQEQVSGMMKITL